MNIRHVVELTDEERDTFAAWEARRNAQGATIHWLFDVDAARRKLAQAYPGNPSVPL